MKKNFIKTGIALLLAVALTSNAKAQTTTTAMNSTLIPQGWSSLPIVRGNDVKGGLHELGTVDVSGGAQAALNALTGNDELPTTKRTMGMVVGLFDTSDQYRQYILMDDQGDDNASNDVWQEILLTQEWVASTAYVAGDAVSYQGATYFKIADGNSAATFTPANWYGVGADGSANLSSLTLGSESIDGIDSDLSNGTGADSLVTAEAVVAYVAAQLGGSVEAGSNDNEILVWNTANSRWEVAAGITIDRLNGDIATSGDVSADSISGTAVNTTGDATIGGNVAATGNVSGANVTASGALTGATLDVGASDFTVDADGNVDGAGTVNAGGLVTAEAGLTISDTQSLTLGGNAVSGISTAIDATSTDDSLVTAKAVYDAISDLDAQVGDGAAANQTLRWNGTAWVADGALTNDGTNVTATGTINADALNTTEFSVDATGNVTTTGTLNADGTVDLAASGVSTTVHGDLTVMEETTLGSSLTMNNDELTTITVDGIATDVASAAANDSLVTSLAVKTYVDDQLGSGGSMYYGSDATFATVSSLANNAAIEGFSGVTTLAKSNIVSATVNLANGEYFFIAVPTNWGALSMFIEKSPIFDGFVKQVVDDYYVYVMQFAVPGTATAGMTFAIK